MDANPTIVANDALHSADGEFKKGLDRIGMVLAEQLANDPHHAVFTLVLTCRIFKPEGNHSTVSAEVSKTEHYTVFSEREPGALLE